jgi:hypothetical protein
MKNVNTEQHTALKRSVSVTLGVAERALYDRRTRFNFLDECCTDIGFSHNMFAGEP